MNLNALTSRHKKYGVLVIILTPLVVSFLLSVCLGYRILINTSASLPHTFYLTNPTQKQINRGDYIAFTHPISDKVIVKRVLGVSGDVIRQTDNLILINGQVLTLKAKRSNGTPLTPLRASIVTEETVFVSGSHKDSFDSRYEEFGLVPLVQVRGRVWPIF